MGKIDPLSPEKKKVMIIGLPGSTRGLACLRLDGRGEVRERWGDRLTGEVRFGRSGKEVETAKLAVTTRQMVLDRTCLLWLGPISAALAYTGLFA